MLENYNQIKKETDEFVASMNAHGFAEAGIGDLREKICSIWSKIKPFVAVLEKIPFVGKYIGLLADLLNAICPK